jgi:hypothetical protein
LGPDDEVEESAARVVENTAHFGSVLAYSSRSVWLS